MHDPTSVSAQWRNLVSLSWCGYVHLLKVLIGGSFSRPNRPTGYRIRFKLPREMFAVNSVVLFSIANTESVIESG